MGIEQKSEILYKDLKDYALNRIKNMCWNVNKNNSTSWSNYTPYNSSKTAPSSLRDGYIKNIISYNVPYRINDTRHRDSQATPKCQIIYKSTVDDNMLVPVYVGTIESQFIEYLSSKGINTKDNELITFKGMLNFMNNLAVFIGSKLVHVVNSLDNTSQIYYISSAKPNFNKNIIKDEDLTLSDIKTDLTDIMNAISNVSKVHYINNVVSLTCSSSSSSSSSSCSSSSSSSFFLAYMKI